MRTMRAHKGFTLLETTFVVAIFTVVMGVTFTMALSFGESAQMQNIRANSNDAARQTMLELLPELREASRASINWAQLPGSVLRYRPATDIDGNGTAVDKNGRIELGPEVVIRSDKEDANKDGLGAEQAVKIAGDDVTVLCSNLAEKAEIVNDNGSTTSVEGFWFRPWGNGLEVRLTTEGVDRRGRTFQSTFTQIVMPRN
ncbi:MAG: hypothetical protein RLZZ303_2207 [Candidatus Hydrogenedentota bacterium]